MFSFMYGYEITPKLTKLCAKRPGSSVKLKSDDVFQMSPAIFAARLCWQ